MMCALGRHRWFVGTVNLSGHQSYRGRRCLRPLCEAPPQQQHLSYFGKPQGPWRDDVDPLCTHGVNGQAVLACMNCAVDRQNRGLR